jgi:hypothetical protein
MACSSTVEGGEMIDVDRSIFKERSESNSADDLVC